MNTAVYIAVAALVVLFVVQRLRSRRSPAKLVREKLDAGALVLDVRTPQEFSGGSYPKAKNIPLDVLGSKLDSLPKDQPIVVFCAAGARAAQAVRILKRAGFADVLSAGGLADMPGPERGER